MSNYHIDATDKKILSLLMKNARIPFLEVARECGISGAAIHQRVNKLEEAGIFKGSKYIINESVLGYNTCAFVGIHFEKGNVYKRVLDELHTIPEIVECHYTTGTYSLFIKIFAQDNNHLMKILNNTIQEIDGIASTETFISLEQTIERQIMI